MKQYTGNNSKKLLFADTIGFFNKLSCICRVVTWHKCNNSNPQLFNQRVS